MLMGIVDESISRMMMLPVICIHMVAIVNVDCLHKTRAAAVLEPKVFALEPKWLEPKWLRNYNCNYNYKYNYNYNSNY